jgi:hypothetical protein
MSADTLKVTDVLDTLARVLAGDPRDWSLDRRDAWLWGVLCGWDCEDHPGTVECDETCTNALATVAQRHGWNAVEVDVLRSMRATIREARGV